MASGKSSQLYLSAARAEAVPWPGIGPATVAEAAPRGVSVCGGEDLRASLDVRGTGRRIEESGVDREVWRC